ncbi:ATP-binding protein [Psychrobacillus sp. L3]|uniref:HAMP domain-containing sensor histidine kinase n=1 Tax=Psychrobacillus sp. L3 TaxID=3236891 RepID=UPI0036F2E16D
MSIRKRLFLSNAAMIVTPIIIILLILFLINIVFNEGAGFGPNNFKQRWQNPEDSNTELFNNLKKVASLDQEKLFDKAYLDSLSIQVESKNTKIFIRKGENLLYVSHQLEDILNEDLPPFGNEGYDSIGKEYWHNDYSIRQYDFYFQDGSEGSIFLLNNSETFVKFARTFFPIIFISLILTLVLTNVLLSYFMSRSILGPVKQLSEASQKISKGDFDFTLTTKNKDELSKLVRSFDAMRAELKESLLLRNKYENNRKELIANISHDLKTPVTSILGYVEGIQDGVANTIEKQERYLETIHTKASYMNRLVEELSLFSELDVKQLTFNFEVVDIKAFINDYLDEVKDSLSEKDIHISFEAEDIQAYVRLDRDKIIRVMENIIYNGVKFVDKNTVHIAVSLTDEGEMIKISIHDNGPGVSDEELSTIFNRFYQTDLSRSSGGSGLGLAIASQIIESHDGEIWAENLRNEGLGVYFTLKKSGDKKYE